MRQAQMHIYDVGGRRAWYHDGCEPVGAVRIDTDRRPSAPSSEVSTKSRTTRNKARTAKSKRGGDSRAD